MLEHMQSRVQSICAVSLWLIAGSASAQVNPELGDVGVVQGHASTQTTTTTTQAYPADTRPASSPPAARTTTTTTESTTTLTIPNRFGGTDHGRVVGHFGVGFFGVREVPIAGIGTANFPEATVFAPTIGVRYWMQDWLGIEAALGLGVESSGTTIDTAGNSATTNGPSVFALALHGGLPLVFAASKHFAFEVIPELNIGFATGGVDDQSPANNDRDLSGVLLELGARVGAEIQFGFIDIPELALQATVGLHLRYEGRSQSIGDTDTSNHRFRFGTTLQGEPWDIFQETITAIYYF
jgi:hypothetical protein